MFNSTREKISELKNQIHIMEEEYKREVDEQILPELRNCKPFNGIGYLLQYLDIITEDNDYINPNHHYLRLNAFKELTVQAQNLVYKIITTDNEMQIKMYVRVKYRNEYISLLTSSITTKKEEHRDFGSIDICDAINILNESSNCYGDDIFNFLRQAQIYCAYTPKDEYKAGIILRHKELEEKYQNLNEIKGWKE